MDTLPIDIIPDIAKHLSLKDLIACCSVSVHWREVFGLDIVWKPHCDINTEEYLRTTPCQVEPKFSTPESNDSALSPIGRWRTAYMREVHLLKNWTNGKYIEEDINVPADEAYAIWFLDNHFFIVAFEYKLELHDTTTNPSVCVANCNIPEVPRFEQIDVIGNGRFVILKMIDKVKVLEINTQSLTITEKHTFCTSESAFFHNFVFVDGVFLGNDGRNLYVWNVESGANLKTDPLVLHSMYSHNVNTYGNCTDVVVTATSNQRLLYLYRHQHHFLYSVRERRFLIFKKTGLFSGLFPTQVGGFVSYGFAVVSSPSKLDVYDYQAPCMLFSIELPRYVFDSLNILGNSLIYCTDETNLMCVSLSTGAVECLISGIYKVQPIQKSKVSDRELLLLTKSTDSSFEIPQVLWMLGSKLTAVSSKTNAVEAWGINKSFTKFVRLKVAVSARDSLVCVCLW